MRQRKRVCLELVDPDTDALDARSPLPYKARVTQTPKQGRTHAGGFAGHVDTTDDDGKHCQDVCCCRFLFAPGAQEGAICLRAKEGVTVRGSRNQNGAGTRPRVANEQRVLHRILQLFAHRGAAGENEHGERENAKWPKMACPCGVRAKGRIYSLRTDAQLVE
eukprot:6110085-Prymnesium_polylepis.2